MNKILNLIVVLIVFTTTVFLMSCGGSTSNGLSKDAHTPDKVLVDFDYAKGDSAIKETDGGCTPGQKQCTKTEESMVCNADGKWQKVDCLAQGKVCFNGGCAVCHGGEPACQNNAAAVCKPDGSGWETTPCGDKVCVNGKCLDCVPGQMTCKGDKVMKCSADGGSMSLVQDCDPVHTGKHCWMGRCISPCEENAKLGTNAGCKYWAVDLDQKGKNPYNHEDSAQDSPFAVVIGNTSKNSTATVRIYKAGALFKTLQVPPSRSTPVYLPPYNVTGSMKGQRAWQIVTDLPVVAYQFNPLENVDVYSNDASMLIPEASLGASYMVVSYPQSWADLSSYVTVIGVTGTPVHVTVIPAADIKAGNGVPAMQAGQTYKFTLNSGEVLNLETHKVGADLTGTLVKADHKVAVFAGSACANVPFSECKDGKCTFQNDYTCGYNGCELVGYCDHLEQQIVPVESLGKKYVVSKTFQRGKAGDLVRVLATHDHTTVTVTPPVAQVPELAAGEKYDFEIHKDVVIEADYPIAVAQFLEGSEAPDPDEQCVGNLQMGGTYPCSNIVVGDCFCEHSKKYCEKDKDCDTDDAGIGDPTFILTVPVSGFRPKYTFLVPGKYAKNYLNIIAAKGASITLDGKQLDPSMFRVTGDYAIGVMEIREGSHFISGSRAFGIVVYGWDKDVSYGYPGGARILRQ